VYQVLAAGADGEAVLMKIAPVLRYPGAKWRLADWIISYLPPHTHYLEPYFGSGAVFFNKPPSKVETVNDIDGQVVNLFRVLREQPDELARLIEFTPWSRQEYYESYQLTGESLEDARRFLVRCWQGQGSRTNSRTGWKNDCKVTQTVSCPRTWDRLPKRIMAVCKRLKQVQIENAPAVEVIGRHISINVCIYADPPYNKAVKSSDLYAHEMTDADHEELLEVLDKHPGPVLLSGYANPMYDERLKHWDRVTKKALAEKGKERTEVLWINPQGRRQGLF
jgi:DNA adenine methylase